MRIVKAIKKLLLSNKGDSKDSKEIEPIVDVDNIEQESFYSSTEHETKVSDDFIIVTDIPDVNDYNFNLNISDEEKNGVTNEYHNYVSSIEKIAKAYTIDSSIKIVEVESGTFKLTFKKKGVSLYEVYNDLVHKYGYSIFEGCILSIDDKQFYIHENTIPQIYEVIKISNNRMLYKLGTTIYFTIINRLANNKLTYKYAHLDITATYYRLYKRKNKYEVYNSDLMLVKEKEDLNYEGEGYIDEGRRVHIGTGKIKTDIDEFSILGNHV